MRLASLLVAFPLSLLGCIDDSEPPPGPIEPEPPPPTTRVVVETSAAPALIAYRDGSGAWKTPDAISPTTFALDVTGPYRVTTVCDNGTGQVDVFQIARTLDDDRAVKTACRAEEQRLVVGVGGDMRPVGRVAMGTAREAARPSDGFFAVSVPWGVYDLVAMSDAAIAIYRDIVVTAPITLPFMFLPFDVDLATAGAPYVEPGLLALNALPSEQVTASVWLDTGPTVAELYSGEPVLAKFAPATLLAETDRHLVDITAERGAHRRSVFAPFRVRVDAPEFELPGHVGTVAFAMAKDEFRATWSELPNYQFLDVGLFGDGIVHRIELSARHATASGATAATFEMDIPGFRTEWRVDLARQRVRALHATILAGDTYFTSTYFDDATLD